MWLPVKSGFHNRKNLSENYPKFEENALKKCQPEPTTGQKSLKNMSFGVAPNYQLARGAHMPWASPEWHEGIKLVSHDEKEL